MKKSVKKPLMKKGGTVKKAFLGSLLGGIGSNILGGMLGGGGGGSSTALQQNNAKLNMPNLSGSMKKGGKVVAKKKAKTGTSLGMKSVKAGIDKNPGVTRADIITAATKKAKSGTSVKKAQQGYTLNDGEEYLFGKAGAMKKTKVKERSTDGDYVTKRVTRTTPTGKSTKTTTRRSVQGFLNGAPRVGDMVYKPNNPSRIEKEKNGGTTKKAKSGGSMKKCRYGCK